MPARAALGSDGGRQDGRVDRRERGSVMASTSAEDVVRSFSGSLRSFIRARVWASELDDVEQEVYLRLHRSLAELRDEQRLEAFLFRIARNAVIDQYRARAREAGRSDLSDEVVATDLEDGDVPAVERELATCVTPFLEALPAPYREALTLTEIEGLTQREAAERLGLSLSGTKSRVQRGRVMLRESFEACCDIVTDARGRVSVYEPRRLERAGCCQ